MHVSWAHRQVGFSGWVERTNTAVLILRASFYKRQLETAIRALLFAIVRARNLKAAPPCSALLQAGTMSSISSQLSNIAGALSGPPAGHLVALHQLNEVLVAADGGRVGGILPYVLAALAEARNDGDAFGDSEIAVLCVRAVANIVDMDPQACRYLARPSALAVLQSHLTPGGPETEVGESVCKLLAITASQYSQSVLRSGALAAALSVFGGIPAARVAVLGALQHACEKVTLE